MTVRSRRDWAEKEALGSRRAKLKMLQRLKILFTEDVDRTLLNI